MELKLPGSRKAARKQKSLRENKDTTDCGLHHRPTVVSTASIFFCFSFFPRAWQLSGIRGESKYTHLWVKTRAKRSRIL